MAPAHPFVRIHNNTDEVRRTKYSDGQPLQIPAHGYMIVPWETACFICGDPYLQDASPRQRDRFAAYSRLKVYYGLAHLNDEDAVAEFPDLTVQTPDNENIPMIMHDPLGEKAPWRDAKSSSNAEVDILRRQIEELAKSQTDLLSLLAAREQVSPAVSGMGAAGDNPDPSDPNALVVDDDDEITFDSPRRTRISGRG